MLRSAASSTASEVGAPTPTRIGAPATAAFWTSSNDSRPLTHSTDPCSGSRPSSSARPITLSIALWRPTSSRTCSSSPSGVKSPVACRPPVRAKVGLAQALGQVGEQRRARPWDRAGAASACTATSSSAPLPADAARRGRVEAARRHVAQQRPLDLDDVGREVLGRPGLARLVDQALAVEEPERELLVVAGRAHRHRQRRRRRRGSRAAPRPRPRRGRRRARPSGSSARARSRRGCLQLPASPAASPDRRHVDRDHLVLRARRVDVGGGADQQVRPRSPGSGTR